MRGSWLPNRFAVAAWRSIGCLALTLATGCGAPDAGGAGGPAEASYASRNGADTAGDAASHGAGGGGGDGAGGDTAAADTSSPRNGGSSDASGGGWNVAGDASGADDAGASSDASQGPGGVTADQGQRWKIAADDAPLVQVSLGGGKTLELQQLRATAAVEGLRVRVLVDTIFYNPYDSVVEGEYRYVLPPESSVSYYAMFTGTGAGQPQFFGDGDGLQALDAETIAGKEAGAVVASSDPKVWGTAKIAKVHKAVAATIAYETETSQNIDPALVEKIAPNTFSARVFPIPAKGWNRILIAWEQTLPSHVVAGEAGPERVLDWSFRAPTHKLQHFELAVLAKGAFVSKGKALTDFATATSKALTAGGYFFSHVVAQAVPAAGLDGALHQHAFRLWPKNSSDQADVLVGKDPVLGTPLGLLRLRPALPGWATPPPTPTTGSHAVFLLDTSRSSHPQRFGIALQLLEAILAATPGYQGFGVIAFDSGASWIGPGWFPNDATGRKAALAAFDDLLLEGASDVGAALRALAAPPQPAAAGATWDVFLLTDGAVTWGDRDPAAVVATAKPPVPARMFAFRLGIGSEDGALLQRLTAQGGAVFDCLSAAEVAACAKAHHQPAVQLQGVEVLAPDGTPRMTDLLTAGQPTVLFPQSSLLVAGHVASHGGAVARIHAKTPDGKAIVHDIPITLQGSGELAPRAWAEIAIERLLASGDAAHQPLVMALSQHYRVSSALASFVLLESEKTYQAYDLVEETAKLGNKAVAALIAGAQAAQAKVGHAWARVEAAVATVSKQFAASNVTASSMWKQTLALAAPSGLDLATPTVAWGGVATSSVSAGYLAAIASNNLDLVKPFADEGEARLAQVEVPSALRALSTVVERNPGNDSLARLVGYRLLAWQESSSAAELLLGVLLRRPFEPQSYRDLARAVAETRPEMAALLFELALGGSWNTAFAGIQAVVREEYGMFVHAFTAAWPSHPLTPLLLARVAELKIAPPSGALRVTVTWNTNATDIDLWVTAPNGEKCFYSHKILSSAGGAGALEADLTQGYGPERFVLAQPISGAWKIQLHYYGNNSNKLEAETWAEVHVLLHAGTKQEQSQRYSVVLEQPKTVVDVATITLEAKGGTP